MLRIIQFVSQTCLTNRPSSESDKGNFKMLEGIRFIAFICCIPSALHEVFTEEFGFIAMNGFKDEPHIIVSEPNLGTRVLDLDAKTKDHINYVVSHIKYNQSMSSSTPKRFALAPMRLGYLFHNS